MPLNVSTFKYGFFLIASWMLLAGSTSYAQDVPAPRLNREYKRVAPPQRPVIEDKIEVIEFFYFGCPVCYELEPMLSRWAIEAPKHVVLRRVPALITANWENFARLYYALEDFGEAERLFWPVFEAIHFEEVSLNVEVEMIKWINGRGLDGDRFLKTFRSQAVTAKITEAREMLRRFEVTAVPTMLIDRKFVTSARMAGGTRQLMPVVDKLIEMARKERAN
jgi:thiol:disulfide interchange protein DsbA